MASDIEASRTKASKPFDAACQLDLGSSEIDVKRSVRVYLKSQPATEPKRYPPRSPKPHDRCTECASDCLHVSYVIDGGRATSIFLQAASGLVASRLRDGLWVDRLARTAQHSWRGLRTATQPEVRNSGSTPRWPALQSQRLYDEV